MLSEWPPAVAVAYRHIQGHVTLAALSYVLPGAGHWAQVPSCLSILSQLEGGSQTQHCARHGRASLHHTEA